MVVFSGMKTLDMKRCNILVDFLNKRTLTAVKKNSKTKLCVNSLSFLKVVGCDYKKFSLFHASDGR